MGGSFDTRAPLGGLVWDCTLLSASRAGRMGRAWDFLLAFFQLLSNHFAFLEVIGEKCGRKEDGKEEETKTNKQKSKILCPNKGLKDGLASGLE